MEIKQKAIEYIKALNVGDKGKLKTMLSHGIQCGKDYAVQNGIDPVVFSNELKAVLEVA